MTLLVSYRHDGFRFDTRKLYFSLDRAKVTSVSVRGEIEAKSPLRLAGISRLRSTFERDRNLSSSAPRAGQDHRI